MKTLVWLASYPKSGSTWMRALLMNYQANHDRPVALDRLGGIFSSPDRWFFDMMAGFPSAHLSPDAADDLQPEIFRHYARLDDSPKVIKCHDAFRDVPSGEPLFPPEATRAALYLVRNPLDVVVSYAHHENTGFDDIIAWMDDPGARLADDGRRLHGQLRQDLGCWSDHVRSWCDRAEIPVRVVRYEDLVADTRGVLMAALHFLGMDVSEERLERATGFSSFGELRRQEAAGGFLERKGASRFFRRGAPGAGREELTPAQVGRIIDRHGAVMERFGYRRD
jgi:hypothetical protein